MSELQMLWFNFIRGSNFFFFNDSTNQESHFINYTIYKPKAAKCDRSYLRPLDTLTVCQKLFIVYIYIQGAQSYDRYFYFLY